MKVIKSPINWYGGKYYMAKEIVQLFPEHKLYCEVFGGAAHVLFKKNPSEIEVYNDIHEGLNAFWTVLINEKYREKLVEKLAFTPYSRQVFEECKDWEEESDIVEKARKFYVRTMQSRSNNGGWAYAVSYSRRNMASTVSKWWGNIDNLSYAIQRVASIQIEKLDFEECISKYDRPETLFYLDPPYVAGTRKQKKSYKHEMSEEDHRRLVQALLKIKGKAILSGYDNEIYLELEKNGWTKKLLKEATKSSVNIDRLNNKAEEFVWINF